MTQWHTTLLGMTAGSPLLVCLLVLLFGRFGNKLGALTNFAGGAVSTVCLSLLYKSVLQKTPVDIHFFSFTPLFHFSFSLEALGFLFGILVCPLWAITSLYSLFYMSDQDPHITRFYALLALSIACALGVAFSGNLLTLFFYYEMLSLSTYALVAHKGDHDSMRAGRYYLLVLMSTSLGLFLPAIAITAAKAGTLDFAAGGVFLHLPLVGGSFLLFLFVFGIAKMALMPMHGWLKQAMVAPAPVSALLHSVAVVKAGIFTLLKIAIYIFGIDTLVAIGAQQWLVVVACITILAASVLAFEEDHLKSRLAYSTISQLGYVVLAVGLATPAALMGGVIQMLAHAFGKIGLFMTAGAVEKIGHNREITHMSGLGKFMPWAFSCFFISSLAIVGLPLFGSFWVKWFMLSSVFTTEHMSVAIVLLISTMLSGAYLLPIPIQAFFAEPSGSVNARFKDVKGEKEPLLSFLPPLITSVLVVIMFFLIQPILDLLNTLPLEGGS